MNTARFPAVSHAQGQRKRLECTKPHVVMRFAQQMLDVLLSDTKFRAIDVVLTEGNPADLLGFSLAAVLSKYHDKEVLCVSAEPRDIVARVLEIKHGIVEWVKGKHVLVVDFTVHPRLKNMVDMINKIPMTLLGICVVSLGEYPLKPQDCGVSSFLVLPESHDLRSTSLEIPSPFAKQ